LSGVTSSGYEVNKIHATAQDNPARESAQAKA
jgi:hypothetical protein